MVERKEKPDCMAHFPDDRYRWLELHDRGDIYGHAAIAGRGEDLELHLTMLRWGPGVRRSLKKDVAWLKGEAKRLGLRRILGVRADARGVFDPGLFRFAGLFGFTEKCVLQTAAMTLE